MTTQEILKMYQVEMINYSVPSAQDKPDHIVKVFLGGGEMESFFGVACKSVADINEIILPTIQHFIDGNIHPVNEIDENIGGIDNILEVNPNGGHFFGNHDFKYLQTVPLEHLKVIAEAWRDFLLEPPLDGDYI